MKNTLLFLLCFLVGFTTLFSQSRNAGETYAVVVGISDYQDEAIPDLRFADKDAEAFAAFLQSPAGGSLDKDHLKVLVNEQATAGQIAMALDWLIEAAKKEDRVIIYFSGHGDVEAKRVTQPGYLLGWDAPSRVYMAGGAINLRDLQIISSTLTIENQAKVVIITDACRAGKLAGSAINGAKIVGANLAKTVDNEIKILSCQPEEYSIEGEQWGGGRGAFSYHLLDGLTGMADADEDFAVNLKEIGRYLEDRVTEEVAPQSQNPMVIGNKTEKLAAVFPELLAQLKEGKRGQLQLFTPTASKGIEDEVLAVADSNIVEMYLAFQKALEKKQFLEPVNACADFYYSTLSQESQLESLHSTVRRNYAAALQDDAQQVLNTRLKSGLTESILKRTSAAELYKNYPDYLDRAAKLLGEDHYMFKTLQARKYYFDGQIAKSRKEKRALYHKALNFEPDMAHAMIELIRLFPAEQIDSASLYFSKATELVPCWVEPYLVMADFYRRKMKDLPSEKKMLELAQKLAPKSILVMYKLGSHYSWLGDFDNAEKYFLQAIATNSTEQICFPCLYNALGILYTRFNKYEKAIEAYAKVLQLDPTFKLINLNLCYLNYSMKNFDGMKRYCIPAIDDHNIAGAWMIEAYLDSNLVVSAKQLLGKILVLDSSSLNVRSVEVLIFHTLEEYSKADFLVNNMMRNLNTIDPVSLYFVKRGDLYNAAQRLANLNYHEEAESICLKILESDPTFSFSIRLLTEIYLVQEKEKYLFEFMETKLSEGIPFDLFDEGSKLDAIKSTKKWKALKEQYGSSND